MICDAADADAAAAAAAAALEGEVTRVGDEGVGQAEAPTCKL